MKKVGIVTLPSEWLFYNYGSLFQAYALQKVLKDLGVKPLHIKWTKTGELESWQYPNPWRLTAHCFKHPAKFRLVAHYLLGCLFYGRMKQPDFKLFANRELSVTDRCFLREEISHEDVLCDIYVNGSDQVWHTTSRNCFLGFAPKGRRIAYAASAPWQLRQENQKWREVVADELSGFSAISVRESQGVDACRKAGIEADIEVTLDPTLLLEGKEWRRLHKDCGDYLPDNCILCYFLNIQSSSDIPWKQTCYMQQRSKKNLKIIPRQGCEYCMPRKHLILPNPYEFIQAYSEADCVVTNSFHGVVFAIIMHRPFLACLQNGFTAGSNCRQLSLLTQLGLEDRIYRADDGDMLEKMEKPIDWDVVELKLAQQRSHSISFLRDAITKCDIRL